MLTYKPHHDGNTFAGLPRVAGFVFASRGVSEPLLVRVLPQDFAKDIYDDWSSNFNTGKTYNWGSFLLRTLPDLSFAETLEELADAAEMVGIDDITFGSHLKSSLDAVTSRQGIRMVHGMVGKVPWCVLRW